MSFFKLRKNFVSVNFIKKMDRQITFFLKNIFYKLKNPDVFDIN